MRCPVCGAAELMRDTRDVTYTAKGETHVVSAVTADFCSACGEVITDMSETQRVMRAVRSMGNESDSSAKSKADLQKLRSALLAGAASAPGQPADSEYFQALRSAVAQGLSAGTALPADQVLDHFEKKYASHVDAAKMIDAINADNIHKEVNFGRPVGKEKL